MADKETPVPKDSIVRSESPPTDKNPAQELKEAAAVKGPHAALESISTPDQASEGPS